MPKQATRKRATPKEKRLPWYITEWLTHGRDFSDSERAADADKIALYILDCHEEPPWVAEQCITRNKLRAWGYGAQIDSLIAAGKISKDDPKKRGDGSP